MIDGDDATPKPHNDEAMLQELNKDSDFLDDVNKFGLLDREKVAQARVTEMSYFRKHGVYSKAPRSEVQ